MPVPPFLGQIMAVGFNFAPKGWALCNGQILAISQNTALFSLFGTTFGGNGTTTFGLPNLQGRVALHPGQGPGLSSYDLGEMLGVEGVNLTLGELAAHTHQANAHGRGGGDNTTPVGNNWASGSVASDNLYSPTANGPTAPNATTLTGGNQPHENRQPYLVINYIVALEGLYPPRT